MKFFYAILATTAAITIASPSYAAEKSAVVETNVEYKDNGGYEATSSSEHKDANGTLNTLETTEELDVNSDGTTNKTVKEVSTTDPKGLMNKAKTTTEVEINDTENGGYEKNVTTNHKDANGTNTRLENNTELEVDDNGDVTSTTTDEKTVDPIGLLNKSTTSTKVKAVNGLLQ